MNKATDQVSEEDQKALDPRRGMKLISCGVPMKRKNGLRIDVSDELLSPGPDRKQQPIAREQTQKDESPASAIFNTETLVGLAAISGILIGYYLGRRKD